MAQLTRRNFIQTMALGTSGLVAGTALNGWSGTAEPIRILEPFHGAVLNRHMGDLVPGGLRINVTGEAPEQDTVTVNGQPAQRQGRRFTAAVLLQHKETTITAASDGISGKGQHQVRVIWDRYSQPRYRFSIDDNSFFLRDIAQKQYGSLFDCFYLKALKDLHQRYGTRFSLNIYYTTGDGFDLTQFPTRYKGEWKDNADWLKLAFHAYANDPDRPYQDAAPEKLIGDLDLVAEQIVRFAGKSTYAPPTVIHWAMVDPASLKPLYRRGVRALSGYFRPSQDGWDINYRLDAERSEYLWSHDALMDFDSGIAFSRIDIVCDTVPVDQTVPTLAKAAEDPNRKEIMDLFTHEQYFWPFYKRHLPDQVTRVETAIRWVTEQGYAPVFFHEGFLGGKA